MKPKMAFTWAAGCGGCEASLLDLGSELLEIAGQVEIVYWPFALDFKKERLEKLADGELHAAWVSGAIRTEAQADLVRLLRRKSRLIVAQGTCAHLGGVIGLANRFGPKDILETAGRCGPQTAESQTIRAVPPTAERVWDCPLPPLQARVTPWTGLSRWITLSRDARLPRR